MPSLTPNFILRGARLATSTVSLPTSCSGVYADWMPLKTVRVRASPTSSVSFSSLVEPSTFSQATMRAMRRSSLAKSSMEMVAVSVVAASVMGFGASLIFLMGLASAAVALACSAGVRDSFDASTIASIFLGSRRPNSGVNALTVWPNSSRRASAKFVTGAPRNPSAAATVIGRTGFNRPDSRRNALIANEQTCWSSSRRDSSFAMTHGALAAM